MRCCCASLPMSRRQGGLRGLSAPWLWCFQMVLNISGLVRCKAGSLSVQRVENGFGYDPLFVAERVHGDERGARAIRQGCDQPPRAGRTRHRAGADVGAAPVGTCRAIGRLTLAVVGQGGDEP